MLLDLTMRLNPTFSRPKPMKEQREVEVDIVVEEPISKRARLIEAM